MARHTKVATCCYCGTRAALVLKGEERHELACSACGAPLHDLKMLPVGRGGGSSRERPVQSRRAPAGVPPRGKAGKKKGRKRRSLKWFAEEAFDLIEDIFD